MSLGHRRKHLVTRTLAGRMTIQGTEMESEWFYYFISLWPHFLRAPVKVKGIQLV